MLPKNSSLYDVVLYAICDCCEILKAYMQSDISLQSDEYCSQLPLLNGLSSGQKWNFHQLRINEPLFSQQYAVK